MFVVMQLMLLKKGKTYSLSQSWNLWKLGNHIFCRTTFEYATFNEKVRFAKRYWHWNLDAAYTIDVKYCLDAFPQEQNNVCAKWLSSAFKIKSAEISVKKESKLQHTSIDQLFWKYLAHTPPSFNSFDKLPLVEPRNSLTFVWVRRATFWKALVNFLFLPPFVKRICMLD